MECEANFSPRCSDIAVLAADIERQLNLAEEANKYWGNEPHHKYAITKKPDHWDDPQSGNIEKYYYEVRYEY